MREGHESHFALFAFFALLPSSPLIQVQLLFPLLRNFGSREDDKATLETILDIAKKEHLQKEVASELDECLRALLRDELKALNDEEYSSLRLQKGKDGGGDMGEVLKICQSLVVNLRTVSEDIAPLFDADYQVLRKYCEATHKEVTQGILAFLQNLGQKDNLVTEDALALLSWSVGYRATLLQYHPGIVIGAPFDQMTEFYRNRYHKLLTQLVSSWVQNVADQDLHAEVRKLASGDHAGHYITPAPEDLFQVVGLQMRLAIERLSGHLQGEAAATVAMCLSTYLQAKQQWLDATETSLTHPASDDDHEAILQRLCALLNNNSRCMNLMDGLTDELEASADEASKEAATGPLQDQVDGFALLSKRTLVVVGTCINVALRSIMEVCELCVSVVLYVNVCVFVYSDPRSHVAQSTLLP